MIAHARGMVGSVGVSGVVVKGLASIVCLAGAALCACAQHTANPQASGSRDVAPKVERQGMHARGNYNVGLRRLRLRDLPKRPVWVDVWYPVDPDVEEHLQRYLLTSGLVAPDAPFAGGLGPAPLVLFSHGAGGNATDYAWLTETLAAQGFVVAGVHHFGESRVYGFATVDPVAPARFWERVPDLAAALEGVRADPIGQHLDPERLYGIGHSAGGFTMLAAAGVPYDLVRLTNYCNTADPEDRGCRYADEHTEEAPEGTGSGGETSVNPSAVVLLDPGMGPAFTPEALAGFTTRTLVVVAAPGDFIPAEAHGLHLARHLASATTVRLEGAGHFGFLGECQLGIDVMGIPLCSDPKTTDRARVHERVAREVVDFLRE